MGFLELLLLILLLALILGTVIGAVILAAFCKGKKYLGPTQIPSNGVVNVTIPGIDCDSFTVRFETTEAVEEVSGTIDLSPYSEPTDEGVAISPGPSVSQTVRVTYASPQTVHVIRFSNGSYGLQKGEIYHFEVGGRDRADDNSGFFCKTRKCCIGAMLERGWDVMQETTEWKETKGPA